MRPIRVLAAASGGGHWEQLMMLRRALDEVECHYVTTDAKLAQKANTRSYSVVTDCNQDQPIAMTRCLLQCVAIVLRQRPDYVVSTGAAPGLLCLAAGRLVGAKAIWIDSIANAEKLSLSGRLARWVANHRLTQWQHLATPGGPRYEGAVL